VGRCRKGGKKVVISKTEKEQSQSGSIVTVEGLSQVVKAGGLEHKIFYSIIKWRRVRNEFRGIREKG